MQTFQSADRLAELISQKRSEGLSIGFVPTMGALHEGHRSLIERAKKIDDFVICSIFVNPTQFTNSSDLMNYPRDLNGDLQMLEGAECDAVFHPGIEEVYPTKVQETFDLGGLEIAMEGKFRPGHFQGVAMVVKRLFEIVKPDHAFFGLKDYQQFLVVKAMTKAMGFNIEIVGCETKRDADGLAMSSRNRLLTKKGRAAATIFYKCLNMAKDHINKNSIEEIKQMVVPIFENDPDCTLEYFEIVDSHTLSMIDANNPKSALIACIAGYVDNVRLIDNLILIP